MTIIFRAKTNEGYIIKVLSELLQNNVRVACMCINESGINIRMMDSNRLVLLDIQMKYNHFNVFELSPAHQELNIGVNLNHLYKMLKSIKKKDQMMFSLDDSEMENLIITIFPKESKRVISSIVRIQPVQHISIPLPDGYKDPVNITSNDFQQTIKDISSISDTLCIKMHKYSMCMASNAQGIYSKQVFFGEEDDNTSQQYSDSFNTEQFLRILKIGGLSDALQIYGGDDNKPLYIRSKIGNLGTISIFIKSQRQIQEEE